MAIYKPSAGIESYSGALSKTKDQARLSITRIKSVKDPLTGEVLGDGKKEFYTQEWRDYNVHPLTDGERRQRVKWTDACRLAAVIIKDKLHPRYMELYHLWRAQLGSDKAIKQFPNFVRAFLAAELPKGAGSQTNHL